MHLRDVDLKRLVQVGVEIDSRTCQLRVLVDASQTRPAPVLHQSIRPVDVEPLLAVPLLRTRQTLELLE